MKKIVTIALLSLIVDSLTAMDSNKEKKEKIEAEVETPTPVVTTKPKAEESLQGLCISLMIFNAKKVPLDLDHFHVLNLSGRNKLCGIIDPKVVIKKFVDTEQEIMGEEKAYKLLGNVQLRNKFNLTRLILSYNLIKKLPTEIGQLTTLKHLDLQSNKLKTVPESIGNLTQLQQLHLENNPLNRLPKDAIKKLNTTWLYVTCYNREKPVSYYGNKILDTDELKRFPFALS